MRHGVHVQFHNICAIGMVILSKPKSHDLICVQTCQLFFRKCLYLTTEICACSKDHASLLIGKSTNLNFETIYIKLYFKNSISAAFYFTMEGPTISNNILRLSADMENLRGLGLQAATVSNTEDGRFKYLVSALMTLAIELL